MPHAPVPFQTTRRRRRHAEMRVGGICVLNSVCQKTALLLLNRVKLYHKHCQQHYQQHLLSEFSRSFSVSLALLLLLSWRFIHRNVNPTHTHTLADTTKHTHRESTNIPSTQQKLREVEARRLLRIAGELNGMMRGQGMMRGGKVVGKMPHSICEVHLCSQFLSLYCCPALFTHHFVWRSLEFLDFLADFPSVIPLKSHSNGVLYT